MRWSGKLAIALAALIVLAAFGPSTVTRRSPDRAHGMSAGRSDGYKANEVIIKLDPASGATVSAINATYGTTTLGPIGSLAGVYRLRVPSEQDAQAVAATMANDARLLYAHPNYQREPPEANPRSSRAWGGLDPTPYHTHYARAMLGLPAAHEVTTGDGIVVAILDTGIALSHPALADKLAAAGYDFVDDDASPDDVGNGADDDGDGETDEAVGHGTHVAGIVLMVAPAARLMPLRVLDSDGIGDDGLIAQAIGYAVDHGAHVINLSLGSADESETLEEAIERATRAGVVVVSASGNANSDHKQYPAAENCALAVTSVNQDDVKSPFANFGSWVDLASPGEAIYSTLEGNGYGSWSGTSMAAPFVSGQAALIRSLRRAWTPRQISAAIAYTARDIRAKNPGYGSDLGEGRIDVAGSVALARSSALPPDDEALISSSCVEPDLPDVTATPSPTPTPGSTPAPGPTATPTAPLPPRVYLPVTIRR